MTTKVGRISDKRLLLLMAIGFYLVVHFGFIAAGGALYVILFALVRPSWTPYLLILLSSVQDGPGITFDWVYAGFLIVTLVMLLWHIANGKTMRDSPRSSSSTMSLMFVLSTLVILYGFLNSFFQSLFAGHTQAPERPYYIVALFMILMMTAAMISIKTILHDRNGLTKLASVVTISITNGILVALIQVFHGAGFAHSSSGFSTIAEASQLVSSTGLGFPRITGPFLSPNALALSIALLFMILIGTKRDAHISLRLALMYSVIGFIIGTLTLSKAMFVFFVLTSLVILLHARSARIIPHLVVFVGTLSIIIIKYVGWDVLTASFRFAGASGTGYRSMAWNAVLNDFGWNEWLFGTGLSHWQIFFKEKVGFTLSDPHSFLISVPGTYGVIGIVFYFCLAIAIMATVLSWKSQNKVLAILLLMVIFLRDLASIPYVLGNTPVTYLIWCCLGLIWSFNNKSTPEFHS